MKECDADVWLWNNGAVRQTESRMPDPDEVAWLHLVAPTDEQVNTVLGGVFGCHALVLEDVLHFGQRPKLDRYLDFQPPHLFISFYTLEEDLKTEEFCVIVGTNYVITVERQPIPAIAALETMIQTDATFLHTPGTFLYRLLDHCVDDYFQVVDQLEDRVDIIQHRVFNHPETQIGPEIFRLKRKLHQVRRIATDARNVVGQLAHESMPFINPQNTVYFVDIYDHASRVVDGLDATRDSLNGLLDLQTAQRANRMNEVMKTLTIIATIFLPLSFIVGLYGMNFKDIPELSWSFGYIYVWALMVAVTIVMVVYFKIKRWW